MKDKGFFSARGSVPGCPGCLALLAVLLLAGCASQPPSAVSDGAAVASGKDVYVVKRGDTLHSIAAALGVDFRSLVIWNNIDNPNHIVVGQGLRTQSPGSSSVELQSQSGSGDTLKREPQVGKESYSEQTLARALAQVQRKTPAAASKAAPAPAADAKAEAAADSANSNWIWPASGKVVGTFSEGGAKGIDIAGAAGDPVLAVSDGKVVYSGTGLRGYGKLVIVKHSSTYLTAYAHNQKILVKEDQSVVKGQKIAEMGNTDADQVKLHFEVRKQGRPVDPLKHLPAR
ncbi:MAG: peptidoglycan DD-metalloendopeptidase family protein [Candidatus Accumulibacter phosphatis]|jgi:lipoprotein NlpD